jgi:hypothetical protein
MKNKHLYPPEWKQLSRACRERADFRCQICGIRQGMERISKRGNPYKVTLQACHKDHAQRSNPEAELLCLCAICHWWFDFEHWQLEIERRIARLQWIFRNRANTLQSEVAKCLPKQAGRSTMTRGTSPNGSRIGEEAASEYHHQTNGNPVRGTALLFLRSTNQ